LNRFRLIFASLAAIALAPAAAQDAAPPPEQSDAVGPRELENFNLEGRVTRPAEQEQQQQPVAPVTQPASPPASRVDSTPARENSSATRSDPQPNRQVGTPVRAERASDLLARAPTRAQPRTAQTLPAAAAPATPPRPALVTPANEGGSSLLVWIAALLFAAGGAVVYWFIRHGRGASPAYAGGYARASAHPEPVPAQPSKSLPRSATPPIADEPIVRRPMPTTLRPKPDAPVSGAVTTPIPAATKPLGIVANSLRPWIEVELSPDRALVDDNGAAIAFNVTLFNSGSAPARDVSIETCLLNAGAKQDAELSEFYKRPRAGTDAIPVIAPQSRVPLRTAVKIPRDMIHEYEVEGRKLFMPMVAVSTRYRWSSGEGQTGVSFLVGKDQEEQVRLAPLRIDQGTRSWKGLGARRYEKGLRN
jgi:hypothetical protein